MRWKISHHDHDPRLNDLLAILGTMLLLILQSIVSVAIIVYFRKHHADDAGVITTVIAPIIAIISQLYLVYLLVMNLETFGGAGPFGSKIPLIALVILAVGFIWGLALKFLAPSTYEKIGRVVFDGSDA